MDFNSALLLVVTVFFVIWLAIPAKSDKSTREATFPKTPTPVSNEDRVAGAEDEATIFATCLPRQFIVLDLETTGFSPLRDEIIEFGAIRVTLQEHSHDAFQRLVKPLRKLQDNIIEITGITQEMVDVDGVELKEALTQFVEFIGDLPLVTFNAEFDMGFLYNAARLHGITINNKYTCALKCARRAFPELPSHKLTYLSELFKLNKANTHRAVGDCTRAAQVFFISTLKLKQKVRWTSSTQKEYT